jgi:ATP-dependent RNA helicase DDX19/DBP5
MANGYDPDPETYLHRIGRTGRFGRVGVALSFVHDKNSHDQLQAIMNYFKTDAIPIDTSDWDAVEELIQNVIKSSRAGKSTEEMNAIVSGDA